MTFIRILGIGLFVLIGLASEYLLNQQQQILNDFQQKANRAATEQTLYELGAQLQSIAHTSQLIAELIASANNFHSTEQNQRLFDTAYSELQLLKSVTLVEESKLIPIYPAQTAISPQTTEWLETPKTAQLIKLCLATRTPRLIHLTETNQLHYWIPVASSSRPNSLLSSQFEIPSLPSSSVRDSLSGKKLAIRQKSNDSSADSMVFGPIETFKQKDVLIRSTTIPGASLEIALLPTASPSSNQWLNTGRIVGWCLAGLLAFLSFSYLKHKRQIASLAPYDSLTGLPNPHLFTDRLKQTIRRNKRNGTQFCVVLAKLSNLNTLNLTYGNKVGEMMLAGTGNRLMSSLRYCDTVTRWKQDEFLILLDICPKDQAQLIADNLQHKIELPVSYGDQEIRLNAALAIACYPDDGHNISTLLKMASGKLQQR